MFKEGRKKTGGRQKNVKNKYPSSVKQAFEAAFNAMQDDDKTALANWGAANPTEFYKIAARLIPAEINAKVTSQESAVDLLNRGTGST